jgi:hypothetical protein
MRPSSASKRRWMGKKDPMRGGMEAMGSGDADVALRVGGLR